MQDKILRSYESFEEIPLGILVIDKNSNVNYIFNKKTKNACVAREFISDTEIVNIGKNQLIKETKKYYNVINNKLILTKEQFLTFDLDVISSSEEDYIIIPLNEILNIKGNDKYYLDRNDINNIILFDSENKKVR